MLSSEANQIANLLNLRNQLTKKYTEEDVFQNSEDYLFKVLGNEVVACVEVRKVQWYQAEIRHLTVASAHEGKGIGKELVGCAIASAGRLGVRVVQCTIRQDNDRSGGVFAAAGFAKVNSFFNIRSGNNVDVYQRVLCAVR